MNMHLVGFAFPKSSMCDAIQEYLNGKHKPLGIVKVLVNIGFEITLGVALFHLPTGMDKSKDPNISLLSMAEQ